MLYFQIESTILFINFVSSVQVFQKEHGMQLHICLLLSLEKCSSFVQKIVYNDSGKLNCITREKVFVKIENFQSPSPFFWIGLLN